MVKKKHIFVPTLVIVGGFFGFVLAATVGAGPVTAAGCVVLGLTTGLLVSNYQVRKEFTTQVMNRARPSRKR